MKPTYPVMCPYDAGNNYEWYFLFFFYLIAQLLIFGFCFLRLPLLFLLLGTKANVELRNSTPNRVLGLRTAHELSGRLWRPTFIILFNRTSRYRIDIYFASIYTFQDFGFWGPQAKPQKFMRSGGALQNFAIVISYGFSTRSKQWKNIIVERVLNCASVNLYESMIKLILSIRQFQYERSIFSLSFFYCLSIWVFRFWLSLIYCSFDAYWYFSTKL